MNAQSQRPTCNQLHNLWGSFAFDRLRAKGGLCRNALGFDLSLHVGRVAPKSDTTIALSPVKTTRPNNRVADLRKHSRTRAEVRRFPQLLCGFVGLLRRRTSSDNLGGAVADRRFVGKPHSGKALEHTCGDELRDDFKSFHGADGAPSESLHRGRFAASPRQVVALCFDKVSASRSFLRRHPTSSSRTHPRRFWCARCWGPSLNLRRRALLRSWQQARKRTRSLND